MTHRTTFPGETVPLPSFDHGVGVKTIPMRLLLMQAIKSTIGFIYVVAGMF
jgi:hypothetical protein